MPQPTRIFEKLFENLPDDLAEQNVRMRKAIDASEGDMQKIIQELDGYEDDSLDLLDNMCLRAEIMFNLMMIEMLHAVREKLGAHMHEYTLTPQALVKSLQNID